MIAACLLVRGLAGCQSQSRAAPAPDSVPRAASTADATTTSTSVVATTAPLPPPPYRVVETTVSLVDPSRPTVSRGVRISSTRALTTVVWAPAIGAHWPLVVFGPGYRVGPDTYTDLLRSWATAGFVVAAPEFPLADPAVAGAALDEGDLNNEPADINFVIASLVATDSPVAAAIDPGRVAVTGHSDGAEAALAVAQEGNPNIKAAIIMAGQPVLPHQAPNPPILVIQGDQDTINPPVRSLEVYQQAAHPRFLLTLLGAPHLAPFSGASRWVSVVDAVTLDFLHHYLSGVTSDDSPMAADAAHPGLAWLR
jgi:predicted dienelactone hydrolase